MASTDKPEVLTLKSVEDILLLTSSAVVHLTGLECCCCVKTTMTAVGNIKLVQENKTEERTWLFL